MKRKMLIICVCVIISAAIHAQGFGFDDEDSAGGSSVLPFTLEISGEIEAGPTLFVNDFKKDGEPFSIWDIISASVGFKAGGKNAEAFIGFNLSYGAFEELWTGGPDPRYPPMLFDEAWLRGYFDKLTIEAGLIKMRWGRMYSPGPLDVINPLDYSDLTNLTDSRAMKIARPMIHANYNITDFSGIEAVFIPNFVPHRFDTGGRWTPAQYSNIDSVFMDGIINRGFQIVSGFAYMASAVRTGLETGFSSYQPEFPYTATLNNFQTGLRFNTVIDQIDLGFQYFYGNYFRPSVSIGGVDAFLLDLSTKVIPSYPYLIGAPDPSLLSPYIEYSRYHQIGADYSQVLAGFTVRAEVAAHITEDTKGDNPAVKNPFLAWSLGFDRDLIAEVNLNIQCNETIRLLDNKVIKNQAMDCEGGDNATNTRLIVQLSKSFFRDRLELKAVNIWDIEDSGCVIIPSVAWTVNDTRLELSAGIFAGDKKSEMGQYWDNSYIKLKLLYSF